MYENMADVDYDGACCTNIFVNNKGDGDISSPKMCRNYEKLLKEALDELNSIQATNRLLQKSYLHKRLIRVRGGLSRTPPKRIVIQQCVVHDH